NATGTAALLPGYIASAWRFRRDIEFSVGLRPTTLVLISFVGGGLGAIILLITSEQIFLSLIPWLILLATAMFAVGPWLVKEKRHSLQKITINDAGSLSQQTLSLCVLFLVCLYGGYFNGGLGIILLAALGITGQVSLISMNGIKNFMSARLTAITVTIYAVGGIIDSAYLIVLGVAAIVGGYAGAAFAYRIPQNALRIFIVVVGVSMSLGFFWV
ncbi:MAG: sulfite exporter TauE/SafE family protein, partial [Nitrosomonas sp.]|nr:sulfite exporter TauE/SafE family protein [Nitrosomonas sp.]